jgi:hypothetical protein
MQLRTSADRKSRDPGRRAKSAHAAVELLKHRVGDDNQGENGDQVARGALDLFGELRRFSLSLSPPSAPWRSGLHVASPRGTGFCGDDEPRASADGQRGEPDLAGPAQRIMDRARLTRHLRSVRKGLLIRWAGYALALLHSPQRGMICSTTEPKGSCRNRQLPHVRAFPRSRFVDGNR